LESGSELKEFLCNVKLDLTVEVLVEVGVLFFDKLLNLLGNDFLELLGPPTCFDLILGIDLQLVELKQFLLCQRLITLKFVETLV
jgi:hypothetical protein